jgi:hypothetical protein
VSRSRPTDHQEPTLPPNTPRFSVRSAVAAYLGYDQDDLRDYRYQPTRTPCEVYSDPRGGEDCWTATRGSRRPRGSTNNYQGHWTWTEVNDPGAYCKAYGWRIWLADRDQD